MWLNNQSVAGALSDVAIGAHIVSSISGPVKLDTESPLAVATVATFLCCPGANRLWFDVIPEYNEDLI